MRLNHDCIRDILLYIEENTTYSNFSVIADDLMEYLNSKYDAETINYHIRQIHQAKLVDDVNYPEGLPHEISSLSWQGHEYIDNIRDNKVWKKLKDTSKNLASVSLPVLIKMAPDVIKTFFI